MFSGRMPLIISENITFGIRELVLIIAYRADSRLLRSDRLWALLLFS